MDENKIFELLEKIYIEVQETKIEVKGHTKRLDSLESDVRKIGTTIDVEIKENLKILSEEQAIMRNDLLELKDRQDINNEKIDDLKLVVDSLAHKQNDQEKEIWELRKVK